MSCKADVPPEVYTALCKSIRHVKGNSVKTKMTDKNNKMKSFYFKENITMCSKQ